MSQQLGVVPPMNETMQMVNVDDTNDSSNGSDLKLETDTSIVATFEDDVGNGEDSKGEVCYLAP